MQTLNKGLGKLGLRIIAAPPGKDDVGDADPSATLAARIATLEARADAQATRSVIQYAMKAHWRTIDMLEQLSGSSEPDACPLCDHKAVDDAFATRVSQCLFYGGTLIRHACPNCQVIFGPQKMLCLDAAMIDLEYRNLYNIYAEGTSTSSIIRTFHLLLPTKEGTYLDFGCGGAWSEAIEQLREDGWNIYGFEPSAERRSDYVFTSWEDIEARTFDGIFSHNVLEHLFDPAGTTKRLGALLTAGGRIVHATPCFAYCYEFSRFHVFFFTGRSPQVLADLAGMSIIDWETDGEFIACIMQKSA
ncbi:class I SAM-dependent methyltransferase [Defluviicoccus vanus]|uniref:Class I SAM-dependent methyltransferase n=1 Tax=Defluviicoccus vanus TaxID=111831 RepID=A0A7H1MXP7_9PROT|nr:class I SAM-dependent methyltransferase [Defluviicoccus vanus]QNT68233.1 class I SAM-dependent methyltransferase [Defluviicoccus vanus]